MSVSTARQKLIQAALELFKTQGVGTPTRKIAELADVNEVTLFRNFGSKYGLLLAVFEETETFRQVGASLKLDLPPMIDRDLCQSRQKLKHYASNYLLQMRQSSALICSVVGEAGQYPLENRQALGHGLAELNAQGSQVLSQLKLEKTIGATETASLLHSLLLGYCMIEFVSEDHQLWQSEAAFLDSLVTLLTGHAETDAASQRSPVAELPSSVVHTLLQRTRKLSTYDSALAYVLFAAGLSAADLAQLDRAQHFSDPDRHVLQIRGTQRPINQWILGKRYGSYTANPLTRYLKSRKDSHPALFLEGEEPITPTDLESRWRTWLIDEQPDTAVQTWTLDQAQQTWYIDMLLRGMSLENLSILTGIDQDQLQPYAARARQITALEQATQLDQKPQRGSTF
jgi:AcrR family transcriptional regulator